MHKNERDSLLKPNKAFPSLSPGLYDTLKVDVLHSVHIDFTRCSLGKSRDKELSVWRFWGRRKGLLENKSRFSLTVGLSCREITNLCLLSVCGGQSNVRMEKKKGMQGALTERNQSCHSAVALRWHAAVLPSGSVRFPEAQSKPSVTR